MCLTQRAWSKRKENRGREGRKEKEGKRERRERRGDLETIQFSHFTDGEIEKWRSELTCHVASESR